VTIVRGAGIATGEGAGVHALPAKRIAASGWASNAGPAIEHWAITVAPTPKPDVAVAATEADKGPKIAAATKDAI